MNSLTSLGNRLYSGDHAFNIIGARRRWYAISGLLLLVAISSLGIRGLNLGIEFKGGAEFTVPVAAANTASIEQARKVANDAGHTAESILIAGGDKLRIQTGTLTADESNKVGQALADAFKVAPTDIKVQLVGPTWGNEVTKNAGRALIVFLVLVALFLAVYFEWAMAVGALVALLHDVLITVGIYALSGFEVTPATVIGFLTILGYSLYDTVVVFDKVKENTSGITGGSRLTYSEAANLGLNQTLVRSVNTTIVALLPVLAILVVGVVALGPGTLNDLSLSLLVGMLVGTYSSIFVATPILVQIKERQPEMQALTRRVQSRRGSDNSAQAVAKAVAPVVTGPRTQRVKQARSKRSKR